MRYLILSFILLLAACQSGAGGTTGSGPVKLSDGAYRAFQTYVDNDPLVFAVTEDGRNAWYFYCLEVGCQPLRNVAEVISRCEARHKRPCKLFAIRDQVVWESPGEWRPGRAARLDAVVAASDADFEAIGDKVADVLKDDLIFSRYDTAPGNRAFVIAVDPNTGKIIRRGYTFGYSSLEAAIRNAAGFCARGAGGNAEKACRVYDVNGERFWPTTAGDLSRDQMDRAAAAGAAMAPYEGERRAEVEWDGVGEENVLVSYTLDKGWIVFDLAFDGDAFPGPCVGEGDARNTNGIFEFTMACADGVVVSGSGTYTNNLRRVSLIGTDSLGRAVDMRVKSDHLLPGG